MSLSVKKGLNAFHSEARAGMNPVPGPVLAWGSDRIQLSSLERKVQDPQCTPEVLSACRSECHQLSACCLEPVRKPTLSGRYS